MSEVIIFILAAMMIGGYNDAADKRDGVYPVHTAQQDIDIEVRTTPGIIKEGETIIVPGSDGKLRTCTLQGTQLFCTDVWI